MEEYNENINTNSFNEDSLEKAIIDLLVENGDGLYEHIVGDNIHRQYEQVLLLDDLKEYLNEKYKKENLTDTEIDKIINKISYIQGGSLYEESKSVFYLLNEGFDLIRDDSSKLNLHIDFINYDIIKNNKYKVVNQYTVIDSENKRPDVLIFINGIPICICEFKSAIKENTTIFDAWKQIHIRYNRGIKSLMKYCLMAIISDGVNTKLGTIFTEYEYFYSWNKVNDNESVVNGIDSLYSMIKGALTPERITKIIRDFIFYQDNSKDEVPFICRYPQFFAATKMTTHIKNHLKPAGDGKGGVYFGATGCGKTLTMLYLTRLIIHRDNNIYKNPTVLIIVDADDLDEQTSEFFENGKRFIGQDDVRSIESREDLTQNIRGIPSGGVYITTIQKFCEEIGLISDRSNIICIADEAHRNQSGLEAKIRKTEKGLVITHGFGECLRKAFPNATYCGFSGTPVDATFTIFGDMVDGYSMTESANDGITVRIAYEPRLARVISSENEIKEIEDYYNECAELGANEEQINASKKAMSKLTKILGHPDRQKKMAKDIIEHYETMCSIKPDVVQKAMIVCATRPLAYNLLMEIKNIRPDWFVNKKAEDESILLKEQLDKLEALPKINLVATQGDDDDEKLFKLCGTKEYRKKLAKQFKNNNSNFKIAMVVDMWITGFDAPSLTVMYIDKPLQRHSLVQTISRVNRVFEGKDKGLIVDYIGIKTNMEIALNRYGNTMKDGPVDELDISLSIFRNHMYLVKNLLTGFDDSLYHIGSAKERLECLGKASEFIQKDKKLQLEYMGLTRRLKNAYQICYPSGELTDYENAMAQFYFAIRSIIYKMTIGTAPDAETMNRVVENMVKEAIKCTGVESILDINKEIDIFSDKFLEELKKIKMPITKFNALLKLVKEEISNYGKTNKIKAISFSERLKKVVDLYNTRDKQMFVSGVVDDFVNGLSDELIKIIKDIKEDKTSYDKLGITYEEKAFYDILVKVRDEHKFKYPDEKCIILAQKIKILVDDKSKYADWSTRDDIKNELNQDLTVLLYENGYPPEWDDEVFEEVLSQAENFKKYSD